MTYFSKLLTQKNHNNWKTYTGVIELLLRIVRYNLNLPIRKITNYHKNHCRYMYLLGF